jgi:hypothetical protein
MSAEYSGRSLSDTGTWNPGRQPQEDLLESEMPTGVKTALFWMRALSTGQLESGAPILSH